MKASHSGSLERIVSLPDSEGHWELLDSESRWDVYMRDSCPFATNDGQTDPCVWLGGDSPKWRKLSDSWQGRLRQTNAALSCSRPIK